MNKEVWEILVPCTMPDGRPNKIWYHRIWDEKIRKIAGGLTINSPSEGRWTDAADKSISERMIPVKIVCTREQIEEIIDLTMEYYEQEAILAYKISSDVILRTREEDDEA